MIAVNMLNVPDVSFDDDVESIVYPAVVSCFWYVAFAVAASALVKLYATVYDVPLVASEPE